MMLYNVFVHFVGLNNRLYAHSLPHSKSASQVTSGVDGAHSVNNNYGIFHSVPSRCPKGNGQRRESNHTKVMSHFDNQEREGLQIVCVKLHPQF